VNQTQHLPKAPRTAYKLGIKSPTTIATSLPKHPTFHSAKLIKTPQQDHRVTNMVTRHNQNWTND